MASALGVATGALKNFNPTASVLAGGGASVIVFAIGCILVATGVSIPFLNIPITMTMVAAAAPTIGHIVTAFVPDTYNQQINALAIKVKTSAENIKSIIPQTYAEYPVDTRLSEQGQSTNNLTPSE